MEMNKSVMGDVLDIGDEQVLIYDEDSNGADVGNSFFETRCHGIRVLILAPHPDDEINVAGNMIVNLIRARAEVFVAYSTNGDFEIDANRRVAECVQSLKILGVKTENVIFLGYGDTYNYTGKPHIFYAEEPVQSPAGKVETYAGGGFSDYSFIKRGEHSKYTRQNYLRDLKDLILDIKPDIIFCVDFDLHADHRMLSIMFETAMAEILSRTGNDYTPEIYKRFAYSTAFTAARDFYSNNLLETKKPIAGKNESYDFDLIDCTNYDWNERVRFPIPESCRNPFIKDNVIARAAFCHKSQRIEWNTLGILNSDEIYFERRTDNLIFTAKAKASSGNFNKVRDFQMINTTDIDASPPKFDNYLWVPDINDNDKRLSFVWNQLQQIEQVKIYGAITGGDCTLAVNLDSVYKAEFKMPDRGLPIVINLPERIFASRADFKILQTDSACGISEIEIFAERESRRVIKPFIKIIAEDNFIYDYYIVNSIKTLTLGLYRFHIDTPVEFTASGADIECNGDKVTLNFTSDNVSLRAEIIGEPTIFDQINIHRVSKTYFWKLRFNQFCERIKIHLERK